MVFCQRVAAQGGAHGRREGNILWYPPEFVILLKADAAVDRTHRAEKGGDHAEENRMRAETFRNDIFAQVQWVYSNGGGMREEYLKEGLLLLKKQRRIEVSQLLESASGGRLSLMK